MFDSRPCLLMNKSRGLVLGVVAVLVVGAGSASVLDSFGSISGTAEVEPPVEFAEVYYNSNIPYQSSGEYVLLRANNGIDLDNWLLKEGNSFSGVHSEGLIALVDNSTSEAVFDAPENVEVVNAGNLADQGLSGAEDFELLYSPEGVTVRTKSYDDANFDPCTDNEAYNFSSEECEDSLVDVKKVSSK